MVSCTRCNAEIENVYFHNGLPYGSECIEHVRGKKLTSREKKSLKFICFYKFDAITRMSVNSKGETRPVFMSEYLEAKRNNRIDGDRIYLRTKGKTL